MTSLKSPPSYPPSRWMGTKKGRIHTTRVSSACPGQIFLPQGGTVREKILVIRFPESKISKFGVTLVDKTWEDMKDDLDSTQMVDVFQSTINKLVDKAFPLKQIQVSSVKKPYIAEELRQLKRKRQGAYQTH